jgi:hypothetical protein
MRFQASVLSLYVHALRVHFMSREYKNYNTILQAYTDDILNDHHVIHDSVANCGIFKNINILIKDIRILNETATINGNNKRQW